MALTRVTRNFQISIPKEIRDRMRIEQGDFIEVLERDGEIIMKPKKLIDADQAWFWTPEWQAGEREADEDIKAGRVTRFKNVEEMKRHFGDA